MELEQLIRIVKVMNQSELLIQRCDAIESGVFCKSQSASQASLRWMASLLLDNENGDGINGDGAIVRNRSQIDQRLEAFSSWKTLALQNHNGAVTSPSLKLLLVRADHSRYVSACFRAECFLRRSAHACVARALRPPCTVVVMSASAWPFQHRAIHRRAGFHTLQTISRLNCWKHVPAIPPDPFPIVAIPIHNPQSCALIFADERSTNDGQTKRQCNSCETRSDQQRQSGTPRTGFQVLRFWVL